MPGDFLRHEPQLTMEQFHAFRDERPKEEKWELIDGVPTMMPPPTRMHQRIARNLATMLNTCLQRVKPEWQADHEVGVLLSGENKYNPKPDVTVTDAELAIGEVYAERFYFAAEILSSSDKPVVIDAKLAYYRTHEHCVGVLLVQQDHIAAEIHIRTSAGWTVHRLTDPAGRLFLPEIGEIGVLGALYRHTPLSPPAA
ncbi:MAG: Uma2 family endonuclease [Hyphomicrobiaceae bacterium]